jgi:hypothetical protein
MRLSVDLGPDALESADATTAISPDGARIVFRIHDAGGKAMLAVRPMVACHRASSGDYRRRRPFFFSRTDNGSPFGRTEN